MKPILAALAVVVLAAPGCASRVDRSDSVRSIRFAGNALADRTSEDARATRDHVTGVGDALSDEWNNSTRAIAETWRLYTTGSLR